LMIHRGANGARVLEVVRRGTTGQTQTAACPVQKGMDSQGLGYAGLAATLREAGGCERATHIDVLLLESRVTSPAAAGQRGLRTSRTRPCRGTLVSDETGPRRTRYGIFLPPPPSRGSATASERLDDREQDGNMPPHGKMQAKTNECSLWRRRQGPHTRMAEDHEREARIGWARSDNGCRALESADEEEKEPPRPPS